MTLITLIILAQWLAESGFDLAPFASSGVAGLILAFVLFRLEPRLRSIENAVNSHSKALIIVALALPNINNSEKEQAHAILREIEKKGE